MGYHSLTPRGSLVKRRPAGQTTELAVASALLAAINCWIARYLLIQVLNPGQAIGFATALSSVGWGWQRLVPFFPPLHPFFPE